jgi:brefeldin A-inhibited guanine nucleotide-exchange protein
MIPDRQDISDVSSEFPILIFSFFPPLLQSELSPKSIACIQALIQCSLAFGNYLGTAWVEILTVVSQLDNLSIIASGAKGDSSFFPSERPTADKKRKTLLSYFDDMREIDAAASENQRLRMRAVRVISEIDMVLIERIFINSNRFTKSGIVSFVNALANVSRTELAPPENFINKSTSTQPRIFCLQKMVEVADHNMKSRSRIEWTNMWSIIGSLFTDASCHANPAVAMYAIDSLKQLSMKFLDKDERANFQFQRMFLKPFEKVMAFSNRLVIIKHIVVFKACTIHSFYFAVALLFGS